MIKSFWRGCSLILEKTTQGWVVSLSGQRRLLSSCGADLREECYRLIGGSEKKSVKDISRATKLTEKKVSAR